MGEASHKNCCTVETSLIGKQRRRLAQKANKILGVPHGQLHFIGERDGILPRKNQEGFIVLAEKIGAYIEKLKPTAIFCPHLNEGWSDHLAAEEATRAAISMQPTGSHPKLYHYCVWFWYSMKLRQALNINWRKALILDISAQIPLKRQAIQKYLGTKAPCGSPWVGKLPHQFLSAFDWDKELYFITDKEL